MDIVNAPWLGTALGVIGLGFAFFQIFKARGAKLYYQYIGQNIINGGSSDLPGGLQIRFEDKILQNLSVSQIIIWNGGSASVRGTDLIASDPLSMKFGKEAEVIKLSVEKTTRPALVISSVVNEKSNTFIDLGFNFLDRDDGFLLKVWHTGLSTKPIVRGTIVGVPEGLLSLGRIPPRYSAKSIKGRSISDPFHEAALLIASIMFSRGFAPIGATVIGLFGFSILSYEKLTGDTLLDGSKLLLTVVSALYLCTGLAGVWIFRRRYPSILTPDELKTKE